MNIVFVFSLFIVSCCASFSIEQFGAIANNNSRVAAEKNSLAFVKALHAANSSLTDRTVLVPANKKFYVFHVESNSLKDIELRVEGTVLLSNLIDDWLVPASDRKGGILHCNVQ